MGTGSGYQTALLASLAASVTSIERMPELTREARAALDGCGIRHVTLLVGDGTLGWAPGAPYDAIVVSAASPNVPQPLVAQLADGGRLVIPVGDRAVQTLTLVVRRGDSVETRDLGDARFVPLIGRHGFP